MQCPIDGTELVMTERQGVEIDYCPKCRGIWLDRGELDKIIDRASADMPEAAPPPQQAAPPPSSYTQQPPPQQQGYGQQRPYDDDDDDYYKRNKKKTFLGNLFDF
jgi:Zn-finger nucleic acid-binding protein